MNCFLLFVVGLSIGKKDPTFLARYEEMTEKYEKDAKEANEAARHYSELAKEALPGLQKRADEIVGDEFERLGVGAWARAAWGFQKMLWNPAPREAAKAAAEAAKPYNKAVADYTRAQTGYDTTAQMYALRVGMDYDQAKKLRTYANQYKLEGNKEMEETFETQAQLLGKQAETYSGLAEKYRNVALRIHNVIPELQKEAGAAGAYAAYQKNPTNAMPPEHAFRYTVAPPA